MRVRAWWTVLHVYYYGARCLCQGFEGRSKGIARCEAKTVPVQEIRTGVVGVACDMTDKATAGVTTGAARGRVSEKRGEGCRGPGRGGRQRGGMPGAWQGKDAGGLAEGGRQRGGMPGVWQGEDAGGLAEGESRGPGAEHSPSVSVTDDLGLESCVF